MQACPEVDPLYFEPYKQENMQSIAALGLVDKADQDSESFLVLII